MISLERSNSFPWPKDCVHIFLRRGWGLGTRLIFAGFECDRIGKRIVTVCNDYITKSTRQIMVLCDNNDCPRSKLGELF